MTLPNFEKCLDFVLLDKPVEIVTHVNHRKFKVVALAISGPKAEQPFLFALAVDKGLGKYRLTILSRWIGSVGIDDNCEDEWIEARKVFFSPWVKQWLANHPEQLIEAGVAIGRIPTGATEVEEHWHDIYW